jgi:hypothetical protein
MANKYDAWVPTEPIQLPIESYQAAGMYQDQKAQQSVNEIGSAFAKYSAINPVSANPKALYDKTMAGIKEKVFEVAKMKLDTPAAKRELNKIMSDPNVLSNLNAVMTDRVMYDKKLAELEEYRKKNPLVNAHDYLASFANLNFEEGNPDQFDPNRFKNLGPLSEYNNINKTIVDEIAKLNPDSEEVKRIIGPTYQTIKNKGLLPQRIREYVIGRMSSDAAFQEQLSHNISYLNYRENNRDVAAGARSLASKYRMEIANNAAADMAKAEAMLRGKSQKEITDNPKLMAAKVSMDNVKRTLEGYSQMSDDEINSNMYQNAFVKGFDAMAYNQSKKEEEWTPMAIAQFNWANRNAEEARKAAVVKDIIDGGNVAPLTAQGTLDGEGGDSRNTKEVIGGIKGLENLSQVIDQNGALQTSDKESAMNIDFSPAPSNSYVVKNVQFGPAKGREGYYPKDKMILQKVNKNGEPVGGPPPGYVKAGTVWALHTDGTKVPVAGYIPREGGGEPVSFINKKESYKKGIEELKSWMQKHDVPTSLYNDFKEEKDVLQAVQAIKTYTTSNDQTYTPSYILNGADSKVLAGNVAQAAGTSGVIIDGEITYKPEDIAKFQELLKDKKNVGINPINVQVADRKHDGSFYVTYIGGKKYQVPLHNELNAQLSGMNQIVKRFMNNNQKPMALKDDAQSLITGYMLPNGRTVGLVIGGGASAEYQQAAKDQFEMGVNKLVQTGLVKRSTAIQYMNEAFLRGAESNTTGNVPIEIKRKDGSVVTVSVLPVRMQEGKYFTPHRMISNQTNMTIDEFQKDYMRMFGSSNNPYWNANKEKSGQSKQQMAINMYNSSGGFDFNNIIPATTSQPEDTDQ